jgi:predicted transcriptional regulator
MRFELKDDVDAPIKIVVARKVVSVDQLAEELNSCRASYQT